MKNSRVVTRVVLLAVTATVVAACNGPFADRRASTLPDASTDASTVAPSAVMSTTGSPATAGRAATAGPGGTGPEAPAPTVDPSSAAPVPDMRWLADSPSSMGHFSPARQASTDLAGPQHDVDVQVRDLMETTGAQIGTSPWHVLSEERYGADGLRTVWGAGLRFAYKFVVDGETFEFADSFELNARPTSITWNLVALHDGRVLVPDPDGHSVGPRGGPCRTSGPAILELRDGDDPYSPIECVSAFELRTDDLRDACGTGRFARLPTGATGTSLVTTATGQIVTVARFREAGLDSTYLVALDHELTGIQDCEFVDETTSSNAIAAEDLGGGATALYVATDENVVKIRWDEAAGELSRVWSREVSLRGRTGTTPTLMDAPNGDDLLVLVDAPCTVTSLLNGLIACEDDDPARIVGVRREDDTGGAPAVFATDLPESIRTVENSPSVHDDMAVLADYSGYLPNGLVVPVGGEAPDGGPGSWGASPDARPDVATGIVAVRYAAAGGGFEVAWENPDIQVNSVTAISGGANLVYGSGADEETGRTYLYGFLLEGDDRGPAGTVVLQEDLGAAPFREPRRGGSLFLPGDLRFEKGEYFDRGNNVVINDDKSLIMTGDRSLVRVRESD